MAATLLDSPEIAPTVAELVEKLGGIPLERLRAWPPLGTATENDVIEIEQRENRLFELVDGILVEKPMGFRESTLAASLIRILGNFVVSCNSGIVTAPDDMMRLAPGLVRMPDVAFIAWNRFPDGKIPSEPIPDLAPDLAVEVLSKSNTKGEMERKVGEYFDAGVRLVWLIDPDARTATVQTSAADSKSLDESGVLDGGAVLPGFTLPLRDLFAELERKPSA